MAELADRKSELVRIRQDLDTALTDEAAHSLIQRLYAEEAVLRASHAATSATTAELLDATIQPLATELSARWRQHLAPEARRHAGTSPRLSPGPATPDGSARLS
jgi:hypothetical protein